MNEELSRGSWARRLLEHVIEMMPAIVANVGRYGTAREHALSMDALSALLELRKSLEAKLPKGAGR